MYDEYGKLSPMRNLIYARNAQQQGRLQIPNHQD
jgi:hypothetical protein